MGRRGRATEPPGGPDLEEFATDLATAHLGFGLFGANTPFEFRQFTVFDRQGWRYSRSGYLGESEYAFALALFLMLRGREPKGLGDLMTPHLLSVVKCAHRYRASSPRVTGQPM